jgi:hypothetical protein
MTEPPQNPANDTDMADISSPPNKLSRTDTEFFEEASIDRELTGEETEYFDALSGDEKDMATSASAPTVDSDMAEVVNLKEENNDEWPRSGTPVPDHDMNGCTPTAGTPDSDVRHKRLTSRPETSVPDDDMENCTPRAGTPDSDVRAPWVEEEDISDEEEDQEFSFGYDSGSQPQRKRRLDDIIDTVGF